MTVLLISDIEKRSFVINSVDVTFICMERDDGTGLSFGPRS
jgi:hypothetical protein